MSCQVLSFNPIPCSVQTIELCLIENPSDTIQVKLTHPFSKKSYWLDAGDQPNLTIDVSELDLDTDVPYSFEIFNDQGQFAEPIGFEAVDAGTSTYSYEKGYLKLFATLDAFPTSAKLTT